MSPDLANLTVLGRIVKDLTHIDKHSSRVRHTLRVLSMLDGTREKHQDRAWARLLIRDSS